MKYIVNLTHSQTGRGKVRSVEAMDIKEASRIMKDRYPSYDVGRISSDEEGSLRNLYKVMKRAEKDK